MRKAAIILLFTSLFSGLNAEVKKFGDLNGFNIRPVDILITDGVKEVDLDCDGINDISFEVLFTAAPNQMLMENLPSFHVVVVFPNAAVGLEESRFCIQTSL